MFTTLKTIFLTEELAKQTKSKCQWVGLNCETSISSHLCSFIRGEDSEMKVETVRFNIKWDENACFINSYQWNQTALFNIMGWIHHCMITHRACLLSVRVYYVVWWGQYLLLSYSFMYCICNLSSFTFSLTCSLLLNHLQSFVNIKFSLNNNVIWTDDSQ